MSPELRDPVCGMKLDPDRPGATTVHQGRTIRFCSERCRKDFEENPESYPAGRGQ